MRDPSPPLPCLMLDMRDACTALRISKPSLYALINEGKLKTFMVGQRRLTTPALLEQCVAALAGNEAPLPSQQPNNRYRPAKKRNKGAPNAQT